jgi:hypothetical protein
MRRPRTQNDRVLVALERAGRRGVRTTDFLGPQVVDGGTPILRLPSRINDLRDAGHRIRTLRGGKVARYVLDDDRRPREAS